MMLIFCEESFTFKMSLERSCYFYFCGRYEFLKDIYAPPGTKGSMDKMHRASTFKIIMIISRQFYKLNGIMTRGFSRNVSDTKLLKLK